jgi:hypothetical protein
LSAIDEKSYYEALGRFISHFAEAESHILNMHRVLAGVSVDKARTLFPALRVDDATKQIKTMLEGSSEFVEFDWVFKQWTVVNEMRSSLVHYGIKFHPQPVTTNAARKKKVKEYPVSLEIMHQLSEDIRKIGAHAMAFVLSREIEEEKIYRASLSITAQVIRKGIIMGKVATIQLGCSPLTKLSTFLYNKPPQQSDKN